MRIQSDGRAPPAKGRGTCDFDLKGKLQNLSKAFRQNGLFAYSAAQIPVFCFSTFDLQV